MGLIDSAKIDNALYGYKTELKKQLRNGEVPNWVESTRHDRTAKEEFEETKERTKDNPVQGVTELKVNISGRGPKPPKKIRERIREYEDSPSHREQKHYLGPGEWYDGPYLRICFGKRGGVDSISLRAIYKD